MEHIYKVTFNKENVFEVVEGTPLYEIAVKVQKYFNYPIMVGRIDNDILGLDYLINKNCSVEFYDRSSYIGNDVYSNSVYMVLILAIRHILGNNADVEISNSIDNGVCCKIINHEFNKKLLDDIKDEMENISNQNLIFTSIIVRRTEAIKLLKKMKVMDKANVLKYMTSNYITIYRLDDYYDSFFSKLAYSTKDITEYKLTYIKDNSFVISTPSEEHPDSVLTFRNVPKIFDTYTSYDEWCKKIGIDVAADLNKMVSNGNAKYAIRMAELNYEKQLIDIAEDIYNKKESVKMVLLAGPSSSGKTTSAKKLSLYLETKGFNTITLSTDDYFLNRDDTPKLENGDYDFENIEAIDLKLFNSHLTRLLKGDKVLVPEYNFVEGKKEYKKNYVQLGENDILVIEGLHCLNERLTDSIPRKNKYKIFIAPFAQLNIDRHNRIHTTDTRKLRRIIRDNRTRGRNAADTLRMWPNIRAGELKWIYPFQNDADKVLNSSLIYELSILKVYAMPLLYAVDEDDEMYPEALRLIVCLMNILPIPADDVPRDSILREFIGNSGFYDV